LISFDQDAPESTPEPTPTNGPAIKEDREEDRVETETGDQTGATAADLTAVESRAAGKIVAATPKTPKSAIEPAQPAAEDASPKSEAPPVTPVEQPTTDIELGTTIEFDVKKEREQKGGDGPQQLSIF